MLGISTDKIREYVACPQFGNNHYGKWGSLRLDQRTTIREMADTIDKYEQTLLDIKEYIEKYTFEVSDMEKPSFELNVIETKDILDIINKVIGEDKK